MYDVRRLRLLHALAVHGTVARAAHEMHLTGPAVSQQLANLERDAGTKLLERRGRGLSLTRAGEVLVTHAEVVLGQLAAAESDLAALRGEVSGTVRLATFGTMMRPVAEVLRRVRERHGANVRVTVTELEPEESASALRAGSVDLAIVHAYDAMPLELPPETVRTDLFVDPLVLALPRDDPDAYGQREQHPVDLAALRDATWVAAQPGTSCHQVTVRACGRAGFVPNVVAHCSDFRSMLSLVSAGTGVGLVPRLATSDDEDGIVLRPLADPTDRTVFLVERRAARSDPAASVVRDALTDPARRASA